MRMPGIVTRHPLGAAALALAGLATIVFVLLFFEPQALFIDDKVDEALPTASATAQQHEASDGAREPQELARGRFRGLAHDASGTALLIDVEGKRYLRFEHLEVDNGPDLKVYLSPEPASSEEGAFDDRIVSLGDLKGNIGDQNYEIPASVDLDRFMSAVVWCERFGVGFAVAPVG
jgi:Electron transfer DM13